MKTSLCGLLFAPFFIALRAPMPPSRATDQQATFWTVDAQPAVRIGVLDGPEVYSFKYIRALARTSDGRIVALDDGLGLVRIFDSNGRHVASYGRRGQGPGDFEMEHLQLQILGNDTIGVYEDGRGRLQLFTAASGFVRQELALSSTLTTRLTADVKDVIPRLVSGGSFLILGETTLSYAEPPPAGIVTRPPVHVFWASRAFREVRDLGVYPGSEMVYIPPGMNRPPLPAQLVYGWDPGGRRVCVGETMVPRIQCYDRGTASLTVTWNHVAERIPADVNDAWRRKLLDRDPRRQTTLPTAGRRAVGAAKLKDTKPAYAGVLVDSELNVWVDIPSRRSQGQSGQTYAVFDPTGRYLGDVSVPQMEVMQIHNDVILGVVTDSNDVQTIVVHRLRKAS